MIDCDALNARLAWILDDPHFITTSTYAIVSSYGAAGQRMHGGPFYSHSLHYQFDRRRGRPRSPGLNIGWALRDVVTGQLLPLPPCMLSHVV